jgi:hypothetical protein
LGTIYTNYADALFWGTIGGLSEHFFWRAAAAGVLFRKQPQDVGPFDVICGTFVAAYRKPIRNNFGFEIGPAVGYVSRVNSIPNTTTQYSIGGFVGLDYVLSNHFLLQAGIQPYDYRKNRDRTVTHGIFEQGTIGAAYLF